MALKDWARRKNRELHRQALEDRDSHLWHSHAYHRFFEGYTERRETDQSGRARIRRVYAAEWYEQDLPKGKRVALRLLYALLWLLMAGAVALAGIRQGGSGTRFYIVIPELATLCLLSWLGYILLVNYDFAPRRMTLHDYKSSSVALKRASLCAAAAFLLDALMTLLEIALGGGAHLWAVLGLFLLGMLCAAATHLIEKKIRYAEIENDVPDREKGVSIGGGSH